nr:immunoglobulin heavy chain junction region [Macaca mulatta]
CASGYSGTWTRFDYW